MQVVSVYLKRFRRNLLLKCVLQPETAKKSLKTHILAGGVQSRSRSFKVADLDINRKGICDFLLVIKMKGNARKRKTRNDFASLYSSVYRMRITMWHFKQLSKYVSSLSLTVTSSSKYRSLTSSYDICQFRSIFSPRRGSQARRQRNAIVEWLSTSA